MMCCVAICYNGRVLSNSSCPLELSGNVFFKKNTALWICSRSAKSESLELGFSIRTFINLLSHLNVWLTLEATGLEMESFWSPRFYSDLQSESELRGLQFRPTSLFAIIKIQYRQKLFFNQAGGMAQQLRAHPPENWDRYPCLRSFAGQKICFSFIKPIFLWKNWLLVGQKRKEKFIYFIA